MNANDLKNISETDWKRIEEMMDDEINTSDIPPLDEAFFVNANLRVPKGKVSVRLDLDADVLEWFKAQGAEFQQRINAALRIYAEAHRQQPR